MPSSRPGKIEAAVFCWIEPPEQPLPIVYLISPYVSTMCSFIIISVSLTRTRFELKSESVRLLSTTMKPRDRAESSAQFCSVRNCRRGWPGGAPEVESALPVHLARRASARHGRGGVDKHPGS